MEEYLALTFALTIRATIHECLQAIIATAYGEYDELRVKPYGLEVIYITPVEKRQGVEWASSRGPATSSR